MTAEQWQNVERIYHAAAAHPRSEWPAYLDKACAGDAELRRSVERMLANETRAEDFLETPAAEVAARAMARDARRLSAGTRIGPYEIVSLLGAGGMGEVYKAQDSRLGRKVAVKVLPAEISLDQEQKRRFLREARSASALNHPHIVTIHDVVSDGQRDSLVMEFVDGETLDRLTAGRGLPMPQVLRYAIQIADALAAAHSAGIVHRDIKPGNVMVQSATDTVKILDFGLAKAAGEAEAANATQLTQRGMIVGTVAYMSPEQAEGKTVDARSDIFSYGALLYELATGQPAFHRDSKASTLAAILRDEPAPMRSLRPQVPRELDWVIGLCLKKQPQRRWQNMKDLQVTLEETLAALEAGKVDLTPVPPPPEEPKPSAAASPAAWRWPVIAALGALASAAGAAYYVAANSQTPPPEYLRLSYRRGDVTSARFAPDGQTILYTGDWDGGPSAIFSTRAGSRESRAIDLPPGKLLSISATGEMALLGVTPGVARAPSTLSRAPLAGGAPREVLENVTEADWGPDGTTLAVVRAEGRKNRLEYPIGKVLSESEGRGAYGPRVSPKGDAVAFFDWDNEIGDYAVTVVKKDGSKTTLSRGWRGVARLAWSPRGDEIWFISSKPGEESAFRAVTLQGKERVVTRTPGWVTLYDVARDGRVLLTQMHSRVMMMARPPGEAKERDLSWLETSTPYDISPDGRLLVFVELSQGAGRNPGLYIRRTNGAAAVRLGNCARPALSPDQKWVACIESTPGKSAILLLPTGAGEARRLLNEGLRHDRLEWMPDGQGILFTGTNGTEATRTFVQPVGGGPARPVAPVGVRLNAVSPDGLSALSVRAGKIFSQPLAGGEARPVAVAAPGEAAIRWTADGRSFFSLVREARRFQVMRTDVASGQKKLWLEIRPVDPVGVDLSSLVITPDGSSYAYAYQQDISDLFLVTGLR